MHSTIQILAWMPGPMEMVFIMVFGLLIFGKRLPEVGKSLGKSIVEFKKGLHGIEDEINSATTTRQDILPPPKTAEPSAEAPKHAD